jgi:SulP family sulfate permease
MRPQLFESLKGYSFRKLGKDFVSGVIVAIVALPLSIALGLQSGVTLQQGIITAIVAGFFIAAFGGSKFQIGGPTAAFVAIIAGYLSNPNIGFFGLQIATVMAGILLLLLGFLRLGRFIKYVPYPVVIGFTAGIGVTLFIGQLKDLLGMPTALTGSFLDKMTILFYNLKNLNALTFMIGLATLMLIIIINKINKKIPAPFIAIIVASLLTLVLQKADPSALSVATLTSTFGEIKAEVSFIDFSQITSINFVDLIVPTLVITFLGGVESLLSCTVADGMTDTKHNANQELIGQGAANIVSPLFGGLPATGAIARTAANIKSGAQTPVSGIIHSVTLLVMFISLMPLVGYIPMAALAAVLIVVAYNMSNVPLLVKLFNLSGKDTFVLIVTCILTVVEDLVIGVVSGIALMIILSIPTFSRKLSVVNTGGVIKISGSINFINIEKVLLEVNEKTICVDITEVKGVDLSGFDRLRKHIKPMVNVPQIKGMPRQDKILLALNSSSH